MLENFGVNDTPFDDNRGQYPEDLKIRTHRGSRALIRKVAEQEGVSIGEFVRRAISARIEHISGQHAHEAA
jgi:uncharacterized protein (DUF1778 family)